MASATVKIPTQLRSATGGEAQCATAGETVGDALDAVFASHPELRERMMDGSELRRFVNVYVGGEDVRFLDGLATPLAEGAEVTILPAVAGGA